MINDLNRKNKPELIAEIEQLQKKLGQKEEEYRLVIEKDLTLDFIEKNEAVILLIDPDSQKVIHANQSALKFYGYSLAEMKGKPLSEINTLSSEEIKKKITEAKKKQNNFFQFQHKLASGETRDVEVYQNQFKFQGKTAFSIIVHDITDRLKLEKILLESEKKFRMFYEKSPVAYQSLDISGQIITVNDAWLQMLGYSQDEIRDKNITDFLTAESIGLLKQRFPKFVETGAVSNADFEIVTKQREIKNVIVNGRTSTDLEGNFIQTHCVLHDITGRKKAVEIIRQSESKFRSIFEQAADYFIIFKFEKGNAFIVDANEAAIQAHGYTREEFIGMPTGRILTAENEKLVKDNAKRILDGEVLRFESLHIRKDGSTFLVEVVANTMEIDGQPHIITFERDISEFRQTQQELNMLAQAMKSINECVSITDLENRILFLNEAFLKTYGYTSEELTGKNISLLLMNGNDSAISQKILNSTLEGGWEGDLMNRKKDGSIFPIHLSTAPIKDEKGKIIALIGVASDITEKKKSEQAILESERNFRLLFKHAPVGIYIASPEGDILDGNQAMLDILGSPSLEETKKINVLHFPPLIANGYADKYRECVEKAKVIFLEIPYKSKWGKKVYLSSYLVPLLNDQGKVEKVYTLMQDVTARKQAEAKLASERNRLEDILEGTNAGTWDWYIQTGEVKLNERWAAIMGYTLEELQPISIKTWKGNVHPDDLINAEEKLEKHFNRELEYYDVEFRQPHKNGNWVWVNARGKVIEWDAGGKPVKMSGTHLDITEKKKAETRLEEVNQQLEENNQQLELLNKELMITMEDIRSINKELEVAKDKAQESERLKSAFLANMSHEIRTPMNGILGFTELLKDPEHTEEEKQEFIRIIKQSGERMLNTVNDLVDISKIESRQMKVYKTDINLNQELDYIFGFFKHEVEAKGIRYYIANSLAGQNFILHTDKEKLLAILINLIKNAIKFTDSGSIGFGCSQKGNTLEFFVKDTGIGIEKDKQNMIFNRFEQADTSYSRNFEGAGLGLSIAKAYIELLGGTISVKSELGTGTKFTFTIPFANNELMNDTQDNNESPHSNSVGQRHYKIIIADDETFSRQFLSLAVSKYASQILTAKTGEETVELFKTNPDTDLILMDIKMPTMDGYEATQIIRKMSSDVIILAQTAYAFQSDREKIMAVGCNDYISKPIIKEELIEKINTLLIK